MEEIHERKANDYSSSGPYENFERSASIAEWFKDPVDKSFVTLIGTKLARLATLLDKEGEPNNESIDDSYLDLTTYCGLWASYHASKLKLKFVDKHLFTSKYFTPFCSVCGLHHTSCAKMYGPPGMIIPVARMVE